MTYGTKGRGTATYVVCDPKTKICTSIIVSGGRQLDTLEALVQHGATGCSFFDHPAPRWSGYIHRLRRQGFVICTEKEPHFGEHPGYHARYYLLSDVTRKADEADK